MSDLEDLIEAVERGERPENFGAIKPGNPLIRAYAEGAYDGSLDAAWKLHDMLLPGWQARLTIGASAAWVVVWHCTVEDLDSRNEVEVINMPCPARAWLLATLLAFEQEASHDRA